MANFDLISEDDFFSGEEKEKSKPEKPRKPQADEDLFAPPPEDSENLPEINLPETGEQAEDAFGHVPVFEDQGDMRRAILNVGREDVDVDGLTPLDPNLSILGGSSEYVIVDVTRTSGISVGDQVEFILDYAALVAAMASGYIEKRHIKEVGLA